MMFADMELIGAHAIVIGDRGPTTAWWSTPPLRREAEVAIKRSLPCSRPSWVADNATYRLRFSRSPWVPRHSGLFIWLSAMMYKNASPA